MQSFSSIKSESTFMNFMLFDSTILSGAACNQYHSDVMAMIENKDRCGITDGRFWIMINNQKKTEWDQKEFDAITQDVLKGAYCLIAAGISAVVGVIFVFFSTPAALIASTVAVGCVILAQRVATNPYDTIVIQKIIILMKTLHLGIVPACEDLETPEVRFDSNDLAQRKEYGMAFLHIEKEELDNTFVVNFKKKHTKSNEIADERKG